MLKGRGKGKLLMLLLLSAVTIIFTGCSIENKESVKVNSNTENGKDISKTPIIDDLSKIENLKNLKLDKDKQANFISFDEAISIIGSKGEVAYPDESNETLKIMYWVYTKDEHKYFLDATFYMNQLVNIESQIVSSSDIIDISLKELSSNYKTEIDDIKSYESLKKVLGDGTIVMNYFVPTNDRIYIWKYKDEFISAYVSQEDNINYIKTSTDASELIVSSTNCH